MLALFVLLATLQLTTKDNNHHFTVKPRTVVVVTLKSNPSTGYHWINRGQSIGGGRLRVLSHRYYAPPAKSLPGAPGEEVWRFRATGKGNAGLWLQYVSASNPRHAGRSFSATIRVR